MMFRRLDILLTFGWELRWNPVGAVGTGGCGRTSCVFKVGDPLNWHRFPRVSRVNTNPRGSKSLRPKTFHEPSAVTYCSPFPKAVFRAVPGLVSTPKPISVGFWDVQPLFSHYTEGRNTFPLPFPSPLSHSHSGNAWEPEWKWERGNGTWERE